MPSAVALLLKPQFSFHGDVAPVPKPQLPFLLSLEEFQKAQLRFLLFALNRFCQAPLCRPLMLRASLSVNAYQEITGATLDPGLIRIEQTL